MDPALLADAVRAGDLGRVRNLVADGADIHGLDTRPGVAGGNGRRPLNWAALNNDTKMIELLLELGADIDRQNLSGFTPLHHAVEAEAVEAIELLLSRGADTTIKNGRNLTPAEFARASRRNRAAEALGVGVVAE
jgi:cytohesin